MRSPIVTQQVKNTTNIHEDEGSVPGLAQWVKGFQHCLKLQYRLCMWLGFCVAVAMAQISSCSSNSTSSLGTSMCHRCGPKKKKKKKTDSKTSHISVYDVVCWNKVKQPFQHFIVNIKWLIYVIKHLFHMTATCHRKTQPQNHISQFGVWKTTTINADNFIFALVLIALFITK